MTTTVSFGERVALTRERYGRLCVGIDPHPFLLNEWELTDDARGAREFALRVVDSAVDTVGFVKPQIAFFERFGAQGFAVAEEVIREARSAGLVVIADVKRGDVGSTVDAYASAWLGLGSPLEADAMTISAFQGVGSIAGPIALALRNGKGLFVLTATSNPEGAAIQQARREDGLRVSQAILDEVCAAEDARAGEIGSLGVVLGATLALDEFGIDIERDYSPAPPVLAPGFGVQGAQLSDARHIFGSLMPGAIVSESRSILGAGPSGIRETLATRSREVQDVLG